MPLFTLNSFLLDKSHSAFRRFCSSSSTSQLIVLLSESMMIRSPSLTRAIGPPILASGTTWPIINPRLAPENRPSVIKAVELARPAPAMAPVGPETYVIEMILCNWEKGSSTKHFWHSRCALRTLVPEDQNGARLDLTRFEGWIKAFQTICM